MLIEMLNSQRNYVVTVLSTLQQGTEEYVALQMVLNELIEAIHLSKQIETKLLNAERILDAFNAGKFTNEFIVEME